MLHVQKDKRKYIQNNVLVDQKDFVIVLRRRLRTTKETKNKKC